jgi:hypothetical protein
LFLRDGWSQTRYDGTVPVKPVISALRRWRQEDLVFSARLGYIARPCLNLKKKVFLDINVGWR